MKRNSRLFAFVERRAPAIEKKESFKAAVTDLDSKFATLDHAVKTLKPRPLVSRLERQLDKSESDFSDSQFGLFTDRFRPKLRLEELRKPCRRAID